MKSSTFKVQRSTVKKLVFFFFTLNLLNLLNVSALRAEESRYFQNVTVETGDTLWSLAQKYLKDPQRWPELLKHNTLPTSDPTVALPGMVLKIPVLEIKETLRAAKLVEWVNRASYRKTNSPVWLAVEQGLELFQDYGVRTGAGSWLRIRFAVGEDLTLGADSFALIRPQGLAENVGRGVNLLSGEARSRGVRLMTQTAKIIPRSSETDYRARIRDDLATVVEVYKGATDVEAKGQKVLVKAGFATQVPVGKAPEPPRELPPMPSSIVSVSAFPVLNAPKVEAAPPPSGKITVKAGVLSIELPKAPDGPASSASENRSQSRAQAGQEALNSYRVQVARESDFREIIVDRIYGIGQEFNLKRQGLPDGRYYFRVSYQDRLGFESPFSRGEEVSIDTKAPILEMDSPPVLKYEARTNPVRFSGRTEPGAMILIQGKSVAADTEGNFGEDYVLKRGVNSVAILAMDRAGNKTEKFYLVRYAASEQEIARAERQEREQREAERPEEEAGETTGGRAQRTVFGFATGAAILTIVLLLIVG